MSAVTIIGIVIVALAIVGAVVWYSVAQQRRTTSLKERYGTEYDRTIATSNSRRAAEAELETREERVESLQLHSLAPDQRDLFAQQWHDVQEFFVDNPGRAVAKADGLVADVMRARGDPVENFEQRAADLSVHHARFVQNYRAARDVANRHRRGAATTEELRRAMVNYRVLFDDLLEVEDTVSDRPVPRVVERDVPLSTDRTRARAGERIQRPPVAPPPDSEARDRDLS
jgi:hypothetical protein